MKVHLSAQPSGTGTLHSWCGTRHDDLIVTPSWDDVTCERCSKEVGRRRRAEHQAMIEERRAAQGSLLDARHPAVRPSNVVDLNEWRERRKASSG